jgi:hypothetical protein
MTKREVCICGEDITRRYGAHPPLWHFYDLEDNDHPDNEPWSEYRGLSEAIEAERLFR